MIVEELSLFDTPNEPQAAVRLDTSAPPLVIPPIEGDALFDLEDYDDWRELWTDMPAYDATDQTPADSMNVLFATHEDKRQFLLMLGENPARRASIWFPSVQRRRHVGEYKHVEQNRYPIYIPSYGRWETPLTIRALERLGLSFSVVVQSHQADAYAEITDAPLLVLPGPIDPQVGGLVVARNFCWQHAQEHGHARHWMLDDNIDGFARFNNGIRYPVFDENPFTSCEDFCDRFENAPMAGLQYRFFAASKRPPFYLNTRVYSCYLIDTEVASRYRWRGPYNDDTDFALRLLKDGYCTILFYHYLCNKAATMTVAGGNTDDLYKIDDGRLKMAQALADWHPDVVRVDERWGRAQHVVNYEPFKGNRLIPKEV